MILYIDTENLKKETKLIAYNTTGKTWVYTKEKSIFE